jgi:hypothetical protein
MPKQARDGHLAVHGKDDGLRIEWFSSEPDLKLVHINP